MRYFYTALLMLLLLVGIAPVSARSDDQHQPIDIVGYGDYILRGSLPDGGYVGPTPNGLLSDYSNYGMPGMPYVANAFRTHYDLLISTKDGTIQAVHLNFCSLFVDSDANLDLVRDFFFQLRSDLELKYYSNDIHDSTGSDPESYRYGFQISDAEGDTILVLWNRYQLDLYYQTKEENDELAAASERAAVQNQADKL